MPAMHSVGFRYFCGRFPNHLALAAPDGRHWSRGELHAESQRLARQQQAGRLAGREGLFASLPHSAGLIAMALACEVEYPGAPGTDPIHATRQAKERMQPLGIEPEQGQVHYCVSPQAGDQALAWALAALHYGHAVVLADRWNARTMLRDIERYRVSTAYLTPAQCRDLLSLPKAELARHDTSSLCHLISGDTGCPVSIRGSIGDRCGPAFPGKT